MTKYGMACQHQVQAVRVTVVWEAVWEEVWEAEVATAE